MFEPSYQLIDISQPLENSTACFPGDTPFSSKLVMSYEQTNSYNLTHFMMSPHLGTHADAPAHIIPSMDSVFCVGSLPLEPFIGPCLVVDLAPLEGKIELEMVCKKLAGKTIPSRLLFRTRIEPATNRFPEKAAYLSVESIHFLAEQKVTLVGIDTPSVDPIDAKALLAHRALLEQKIAWLENIELAHVVEGSYWLLAAPLKMVRLEAAPVRAVLLSF